MSPFCREYFYVWTRILESWAKLFTFLREFFYSGGLYKNIGHHSWPTTRNLKKTKTKKKHRLKRPEAVLKKVKFGPKYEWSKISYLEFFCWKYYYGLTTFVFVYSCTHPSGFMRTFFNFRFPSRKSQTQQ